MIRDATKTKATVSLIQGEKIVKLCCKVVPKRQEMKGFCFWSFESATTLAYEKRVSFQQNITVLNITAIDLDVLNELVSLERKVSSSLTNFYVGCESSFCGKGQRINVRRSELNLGRK